MRVRGPAVAAILLLIASELAAQQQSAHRGSGKGLPKSCRRSVFEGTVRAGQSFHRAFGGGLEMVLEAVPHGWILRVVPAVGSQPEIDFAELATPPFRSINPLLLTTDFGFRSQDVLGWNPRTFRYLSRRSELAVAQQAYRAVLSSASPTPAQEMAVAHVAETALEGTIEVLDAVLIPGTADPSRSAALVATHYSSTAHTVQPGAAGALGEVLSLRFRASLSAPGATSCSDRTTSIKAQ